MTVLAVNQQCRITKSQTSTQVQASIVGRFDTRRGTILLRDLNTSDYLICRINKFHHEFTDMAVCVSTWNYIYRHNASWIEIYLEDVYPVGSNMTQSVMEQALYGDQIANDLLPTLDLSFCSITDLLSSPREQLVHVAGRVVAKPVRNLSTETQFVIELASLRGEASTLVVFEGLAEWYHTFDVGSCHVFLYVQAASLVIQEEPVRGVLAFVAGQSRTYRISEEQIQQLPSAATAANDEQLPPAIPRPVETTSMATYSGIVTRVIDPAFGVYELDNRVITCLFNYTDYALTFPYRLGMLLRISCAHMLAIESGGSAIMRAWRSPTVERGDSQSHVILVGCLRTHVQIVGFPAHVDVHPMTDTRYGSIFAECVRIRADFDTLIQKLEYRAAVYGKFDKSLSPQQIQQISGSSTKPSIPFGDMFGDLFHHEQACSAVKTRGSTIQFTRYPCICDMDELLAQTHQVPSLYAGATESSREDLRVEVFQAAFEEEKDGMVMMGTVDAMADGRLYFIDDTGRIPLVVLPQRGHCYYQGDVYRLRRFQLIREDLDYQEEQGEKALVDCAYIVCKVEDMERVAAIKSASQRSIVLPLGVKQVAGFKGPRDESIKSLSVLRVVGIQPTLVSTQPDRTFELNAHVRAIRYPVIQDDDSKSGKPDEVLLIFNSKTQSTRHLPQLRVGCWVGIAAEKEEYITVDWSKYVPKRIRVPVRPPPSLVVDPQMVLTTNVTKQYIRLTSMDAAASAPAETGPRIYQVRELLKPCQSGDGPSGVQIGNKLYADTVSVQGVIVSKGFREHQQRAAATVGLSARQLFGQFGVGTGQQGRNQMFFRLRQTDGLDTVDIYMDVWNQTYPLGLIPGARVTFYHVVRKATPGALICQALSCTHAELSELRDPTAEVIATEQIPPRRLADLARARTRQPSVFKLACTVKYVSTLVFSWLCTRCGTALVAAHCHRHCKAAPRVFTAHAVAALFDGTAHARAYFDGDRLVFSLLSLAAAHIDAIKAAALAQGPLAYHRWDGRHGPLHPLCERATNTGQVFMLYAHEIDRKPAKDASLFQQLQLFAKADAGRALVVPACPTVAAVEIERLDPADCAWDLIVQMGG